MFETTGRHRLMGLFDPLRIALPGGTVACQECGRMGPPARPRRFGGLVRVIRPDYELRPQRISAGKPTKTAST